MSLDDLLATLGDGSGAGDDLEYDPSFSSMERAAQPAVERRMGDAVLEAAEPDHKEVRAQALDVLRRSKDLRAAVYLGTAVLYLDGFPEFAKVTAYMRRVLEEMWDTCHPQLDADDDDDPTMRVNAVLGLADARRALRAIRMAPLTRSRMFGTISLQDIDMASGEIPVPEGLEAPPSEAAIAAAFRDTDPEILSTILKAVAAAHGDLLAIDAVFTERTPGRGPSLDEPLRALKRIRDRLQAVLGTSDADAATDDVAEGQAAAAGTVPAAGPKARAGEIGSSADVTEALDRIIAYYMRNEPSSPVPILLKRAKRLVNASFFEIIREMAPNGMDNVVMIAGTTGEDDR
jgi:type VI secretion system protein ImpA